MGVRKGEVKPLPFTLPGLSLGFHELPLSSGSLLKQSPVAHADRNPPRSQLQTLPRTLTPTLSQDPGGFLSPPLKPLQPELGPAWQWFSPLFVTLYHGWPVLTQYKTPVFWPQVKTTS